MSQKIFDISLAVSGALPVWPGDPSMTLHKVAAMDDGESANISSLTMGVHCGTHVDAPHHFLNEGRTVEQLPLEILTGPCYVAWLPDKVSSIDAQVLQDITLPEDTTRVLFRTSNSRLWAKNEREFNPEFVAINAAGASWLVRRGIKLVGVDYLSVAPFDEPAPTHRILLEAGVVLLEGLDLSAVPAGAYDLYCLPLKIIGAEGAPARAILIQA